MRKIIIMCMAVTAFVCFSMAGMQTAWAKPQENCPVMGGKISKEVFVDHSGKRVYFCCNGCPETFKKDPDKYIKKLESEGVELEKAPPAPQKAK